MIVNGSACLVKRSTMRWRRALDRCNDTMKDVGTFTLFYEGSYRDKARNAIFYVRVVLKGCALRKQVANDV